MEGDALEQLYGRYRRELLLYLLSLCGDRTRAEDLLQETFLKALLSLPEGHPNVRAWLYAVGRNLWISSLRRQKREAPEEAATPSVYDDPAAGLIADERRRALFRALARLEERRREILELQYFSGLSQREIAAILRMTPENVRVLASRARKELRRILEEDGYDLS